MSTELPVEIAVSGETLRLISEVDRYQGHWSAIQGLSPEKLSHLRQIATIESVGSSTRIEGDRGGETQ